MMTSMERDSNALDAAEESNLGFDQMRSLTQSELEEVLAAEPPLFPEVAHAVSGFMGS